MFEKKDKEAFFQRNPLWRAYRTAKRFGGRNNSGQDAKSRERVFCIDARLPEGIIENPGKAVVGALAVVAVLGLGIWGGMALRRKRRSSYRSPYESRKFRRGLADSGGYEAVGI